MRKALWLLIPFLSFAYAQNIDVVVKSRMRGNRICWDISGNTDLPAQTRLMMRLSYGKKFLPGGSRQLIVRAGGFRYEYTCIASRAPSGEYTLKIDYSPLGQREQRKHAAYTAFSIEKKFYHASARAKGGQICSDPSDELYYQAMSEGRRNLREQLALIAKLTVELKNFNAQLKRTSIRYLYKEKKTKADEVKKWIAPDSENGMFQTHAKMCEAFKKIAPPKLMASGVNPATIMEMREALKISKYLLKLSLNQLYARIERKVPAGYRLPPDRKGRDFRDRFSYFQSKIDIYLERIHGHNPKPFPQDWGIDDLERDLVWFNAIFRHLVKNYRRQKNSLHEKDWEMCVRETNLELDDWVICVADYRKSPLVSEPKILLHIEKMGKMGRRLVDTYDAVLHKSEKEKSIEPVKKELRKSMAGVDAIINAIMTQREADRNKAAEDLQVLADGFYLLEELYYRKWQEISVQENDDKHQAAFKDWYDNTFNYLLDKHEEKINEYGGQHEAQQYFFELAASIKTQLRMLRQFVEIYLKEMETGEHPSSINYLKYHGNMRRFKQKIAAKIGAR